MTRHPEFTGRALVALAVLAVVLAISGCTTEDTEIVEEDASFAAGEDVVFQGSMAGDTISIVDPDGAEIWRGEAVRNGSFRVPLNAEPGTYEVLTESGSVKATFSVSNPEMAETSWRETDPDMREQYVYPSAIGSGEIDSWRSEPVVNEIARSVTKNASGRENAFRALADYTSGVVENPAKRTFSQVIPPGEQCRRIEELGTSQGDCTEAALLLTALSRSVGIPTRYVMDGGVEPYTGDDSPGLEGHAWVEAYVDGRWVMADASPKNASRRLTYDNPRNFVAGKMTTAPAAYVPTGREYVLDAHLRNGWVNSEDLAQRYMGKDGYLVLDLEAEEETYYDVKFTWKGKGNKIILQTSTEATPQLYVSKSSVSDGTYSLRSGEEWVNVPQGDFRSP